MAKGILPQLRANGKVTRGWLGVVIQKITPELAAEFSLADPKGALVTKVAAVETIVVENENDPMGEPTIS